MKRLLKLLSLLLLTITLSACGKPQPSTASLPTSLPKTPTPEFIATTIPRDPIHILFIGNSLTFYNELPEMFAELARAGGFEIIVDMSAQGGKTCADHAVSAMTRNKIAKQEWDFVILQEQSNIPALAEQRKDLMYPAIRKLDEQITAHGATTVLFMSWGRRDGLPTAGYEDFESMQAQVESGYKEIANELNAILAPVGVAWQNAITQNPELELWQADGLHPTPEGSYLAASVFYAILFQQSPEELIYTAGIPEETTKFLQTIAAEVVLKNPGRWNIP